MANRIRALAASMLAVSLVACGGGGSGPVVFEETVYTAFMANLDGVDPGFHPDQLLENLALGLDFDVLGAPVEVTALGVFDWEENDLASDHRVAIYDRDGTEIVSITVGPGEGFLQNGFRYIDLPEPVVLPPGFAGTVVVGYADGNADRNANTHGELEIDPPATFDDGLGALANVGESRFGLDPDGFPDIPDRVHGGGVSARYHAASFCFRRP